jgi:hypothetical protein
VPPGSGSIVLGEHELVGRSSAVPQGRGLFSGMSVDENLELGGLKRQTGHGVHWTRERIYDYFPRIRERLHSPADLPYQAASSRWYPWRALYPGTSGCSSSMSLLKVLRRG